MKLTKEQLKAYAVDALKGKIDAVGKADHMLSLIDSFEKMHAFMARQLLVTEQEKIKEAIEKELPSKVVLKDEEVSQVLRISLKTLFNRRASQPETLPPAFRSVGSKKWSTLRDDLVQWLAQEKYQSMKVRIHRCL